MFIMNFIKQTKLGHEGNCLEACISSLTGIPLNDFPDLSKIASENSNWWKILNNFLQENYEIYCESVNYEAGKNHYKRGIVIAIGNSPNCDNEKHAVLWDMEKDKMIFDPSPTNRGLKGKPDCFGVLINYYKLKEER